MAYRTITWVGAIVLFIALSAALFWCQMTSAAGVPAVFPFYSLVFFFTSWRQDAEMDIIFLFLCLVSAAISGSIADNSGVQLALGVEYAGLLLLSGGCAVNRGTLMQSMQETMIEAQELEAASVDLQRDLNYYTSFQANAAAQISLRRDLATAVKGIGTTLDRQEVQRRLLTILKERYGDSRINVVPAQSGDRLNAWCLSSHTSVITRDVRIDERFAGAEYDFRSAIVAALMVMKRPYAVVRLEHSEPEKYNNDDLRTVDLFSTMASLALENIHYLETVNDLAAHDALTQLYTHRAFQIKLQEEVLRSSRSQAPFSLILCDVDHFKKYNDTYGHQAGDTLLQKVAAILRESVRAIDFTARYGGEEFTIILPGMPRAEAAGFAEQLRQRVAAAPFNFNGTLTSVTMSFGVANFPQDGLAANQLVHIADERLYRAKQDGRNRVIG